MSGARSRSLKGASGLQLSLPFEAVAPQPLQQAAAGAGQRTALLDGQRVEFTLRRSRRRTLGFQIDERGLTVTAPRWFQIRDLDSALQEKSGWILKKLVEWRDYQQRRARLAIRWEDGESLRYLGRTLHMRRCEQTTGAQLDGDILRIGLASDAGPQQMRDLVCGWLQREALRVFEQRLPAFCERLGRTPRRWSLSSARTRWGSCTSDGVIRLNWRLIHFPIDLIDYVVAHEVAHLKELNHSPDFWATVEQLLPRYQVARGQLRALQDEGTVL